MTKVIDAKAVPSVANAKKKIALTTVSLRNVICEDGSHEDITVEVLPFDERNDDHVDFAYAYSDMLYRAPSAFRNISEVSRAYVSLFMVHKAEDEANSTSVYNKVCNDLRACRTLFNQDEIQKALQDFFENA